MYDEGKLLSERTDKRQITYMYDIEGISGIMLHTDRLNGVKCEFVKDTMNNVIAIIACGKTVAEYEYDAWGNCKIVKNEYDIATINPIRWKSLYYDEESKFYYINGRYYSPEIKRYLSPLNPETAITNAAQIYGLNLYLLTLTNPIEILYNEYGIGTGIELTGVTPELDDWALFERWWEKFWNSTAGKVLGIGLLVAATVLAAVCPAFMPMYKAALVVTGLSLAIGGVIAGFRSVANGEPYWDGFSDYLNDNWSQTVALEMGTSMLLFGISSAANAVYKSWSARKNAKPVNLTQAEKSELNIGDKNAFKQFADNPKSLWGKSAEEVGEVLGDGWTKGIYGSGGTGWKYIKGDKMVAYHPGGGRHIGQYYKISSAAGKIKVVGNNYKIIVGDKATIIYIN